MFDVFFGFLISFFKREYFFVTILFTNPCTDISHCSRESNSFLCIDHECCHDTSVVTAHVDHIVGFSMFTVFQVSSLDPI